MTAAYREWSKRLDAGTLTIGQVRQFAAAISTVAVGDDARGKRSNLTGDERARLYARVKAHPVRLSDEHTTQALAWFKRQANHYQHGGGLGMSRYLRDAVLERFSHFTFDGEYVAAGRYVWPVWTMHLNGERTDLIRDERLRYYAIPWQARSEDDSLWSDYWFGNERG